MFRLCVPWAPRTNQSPIQMLPNCWPGENNWATHRRSHVCTRSSSQQEHSSTRRRFRNWWSAAAQKQQHDQPTDWRRPRLGTHHITCPLSIHIHAAGVWSNRKIGSVSRCAMFWAVVIVWYLCICVRFFFVGLFAANCARQSMRENWLIWLAANDRFRLVFDELRSNLIA